MLTRLLAALVLSCAVASSAHAAENWKQTGEAAFKGHRLTVFVEETSRRGLVKLDDREIATTPAVSEIGKIRVSDAESSVLFSVYSKAEQGDCGSFILVAVPLGPGNRKPGTLAGFGACNSKLTITVNRRKGWGAFYAIAYWDDRASASVALMRDAALTTQEVKAPPCLFQSPLPNDCLWGLQAEALGSVERGVLTGEGAFAHHRVETYLNRATGKATLELDRRVLRTFDDASEFHLEPSRDGELGLFTFWLKPKAEQCPTRPLVFLPAAGREPQVVTGFAPCAERMLRTLIRKPKTSEWIGIAYRPGEPTGFVAAVIDGRLATHTTRLPSCLMTPDGARSAECLRQALAPFMRAVPGRTAPPPAPGQPTPVPPAQKPARSVPI